MERHCSAAQTKERLLARFGQFHHMNPTVGRVAAACDQPVDVHGVEVVSKHGLRDPNRLGQFAQSRT